MAEFHYRYVVEAVDVYPRDSEHYRAKRDYGIDPDQDWRLIWSFRELEDAVEQMKDDQWQWQTARKYRVRDTEIN